MKYNPRVVFTARRYAKRGICRRRVYSVWADFKFGIQVGPSIRTTNRPGKGRGYVAWPIVNFGRPIHISEMAKARAVKFCKQVGYIKSYQKNEKSPLKGA